MLMLCADGAIRQVRRGCDAVTPEKVDSAAAFPVCARIAITTAAPADNGEGVFIGSADVTSPYSCFTRISDNLWSSFVKRLCKLISDREWRPYIQNAAQRKAALKKALAEFLGENEAKAFVRCEHGFGLSQFCGLLTKRSEFPLCTSPPLSTRFVAPAVLAPSAPPLPACLAW